MDVLLNILIIIVCFVAIIWGGDRFVDASVALAKKIKVPTAVIGATITSIGTTLPELLVTVFSGASNASGLAMGNALGSVIFNSCVIGGLLLIFLSINIKESGKTSIVLLAFSVAVASIMCINKALSLWECIILLLFFMAFIYLSFKNAKRETKSNIMAAETKSMPYYVFIFVLSAIAIGAGAYFSVQSATKLAQMAGLSDTIIGLTIISIGTSLPELITTITAIRKKEAGLGLGNIIGANTINISLLVGLVGVMNGGNLAISNQTITVAIPVALIATAILLLPPLFKNKSYKWQGWALIATFAVYYTILIASAIATVQS